MITTPAIELKANPEVLSPKGRKRQTVILSDKINASSYRVPHCGQRDSFTWSGGQVGKN